MKQIPILILFSFFSINCIAQYFYNDIVATQLTNKNQQLLQQNKIKLVTAVSKENDGTITEGFSVEQKINKDASEIITTTKVTAGVSASLVSSFEKNKLIKTQSESNNLITTTEYMYTIDGLLQSIASSTTDTSTNGFTSENHIWLYNSNNLPIKMQRIKNNSDTTFIDFVLDDKQLVIEEHWKRNGKNTESYFYYYNDKNLLTDIVRYNVRLKKMLPDFMYEYDAAEKIKQMIQVSTGGNNYSTWRYTYNDKGLKQKEVCYNKQKQLVGIIEYSYNN